MLFRSLLANIYMNRFLKHFRQSGAAEAFRAHVVAYADDLVILSRGRAAEALTWMRDAMTKLGLTLNVAKTSLKDARKERFDFLGYSFGPHWFKKNGKWYLGASPSKKRPDVPPPARAWQLDYEVPIQFQA